MPVTIAVCSSALMSTLQTPGDKQWKLVNLHLQPAHVQLETKQGNRIQKVLLLNFLLFCFPPSLTPFLLAQSSKHLHQHSSFSGKFTAEGHIYKVFMD